jgi:hypothetical protein
MESLQEATRETGGSDGWLDRLDTLVGQLPRRRQKRLVRAITAVVMIVANEQGDVPAG